MMGTITTKGVETLIEGLGDLASIPDGVIDEMLNAEADVIVSAQQASARTMGVYNTGTTARSIKKGKTKKTATEKSITVSPQGTNAKGNRNATVAFINEYGKKGQRARPFIQTANKKAEQEAVGAGEKVYKAYLDSKNL